MQTKKKHTGKEHKHKNNKKYDLTRGTLSTVPETQFQETCDRESITLPMSFGLNWTTRGSAVHCELPYFRIAESKTHPGGQRLRPHPGPWPNAKEIQNVCSHVVLETESAWQGKGMNKRSMCERISCEAMMACSQ